MLSKDAQRKLDTRLLRLLKKLRSELSHGELRTYVEGIISAYKYEPDSKFPRRPKNKLVVHNWKTLYLSKKDIPFLPFGDITIDDSAQALLEVFWQMMHFVRDAKSPYGQMECREKLEKALSKYLSGREYDVVDEKQPPSGDTAHSTDFRSVKWSGTQYSFTANQALVVKILFENFEKATPEVGDAYLLKAVDHASPPKRLNLLFRDHPAWETMIVSGQTRGTRRLIAPDDTKNT